MLRTLFSGNFTMQQIFGQILSVLAIVFLILPFHEWAHAMTAYILGDKGIKQRGRLSLNPLSHIDPVGALMLLLIGFGWAKPVPVDPRYFKHPKLGMAITAVMGPIANLVAALVGLLAFNAIYLINSDLIFNGEFTLIYYFLSFYVSVNIALAVFNLIPIPPLDGSKVLFLFLPDKAVDFMYRYQQFFYIGLFVLIWSGVLDPLLAWAQGGLGSALSWLADLPFKPFVG